MQLVEAAASGRVERVRELLAQGADVDERGDGNRTAVTAAALGEHVGVVRVLIDAGADVDLQDDDRNNPLLVCGINGNVALLREVLRAGPDLAATNRYGGVAHIPASERGRVQAEVEQLAEHAARAALERADELSLERHPGGEAVDQELAGQHRDAAYSRASAAAISS